jgi:hypothetical protein
MKTSSIKPRKYGRNHEFQGDNVVIINEEDDNIASFNKIQNISNSFKEALSEEENSDNENIKDINNTHVNEDYYNNFLLNLNKLNDKEVVTLNKNETKIINTLKGSNIQKVSSKHNNNIKINSYDNQFKISNEKDNLFLQRRSQSNQNFMRCKFNCESVKKMFDKVENIPGHLVILNNNTNNLINVNKKIYSGRKNSGSPQLIKRKVKDSNNNTPKNKRKSKKKYSIETNIQNVENSCRTKEIINKHILTEKDKEEQLHKIKMTNYSQNEFLKSNLSKIKTFHIITGTVVEEEKQREEEKEKEDQNTNKGIIDINNNNHNNIATNNICINFEKLKKKKILCCLPFLCNIK